MNLWKLMLKNDGTVVFSTGAYSSYSRNFNVWFLMAQLVANCRLFLFVYLEVCVIFHLKKKRKKLAMAVSLFPASTELSLNLSV